MEKQYIESLLKSGFNIMPINQDKRPLQKWTSFQSEKINSLSDFKTQSDYYALICGFADVECIDIDLKVIIDFERKKLFKKELFELLNDNIDDFYKKVVIKKTVNNGLHIIYKAKNIEGNGKLANIKEHKEAVIETRGIGGYICMYSGVLMEMDYHNIQYITDEERDIIISCCKSFNEPSKESIIEIDRKTEKNFIESDVTPWVDFNNKNSIWDVISNEFSIVKKLSNKILIRRHGAKSPHSGYIYPDSDCMYLFSNGTIYPSNELISAFKAYAIKNYNSDYSKAASMLYSDGYGSRNKPKNNTITKKIHIEREKPSGKINFPIEIFTDELVQYMLLSNKTLNNSIDYMSMALLWSVSLMIGNTINVEVKRGWKEISTLWIAIVGAAGVGKTPSLNSILFPLFALNRKEILKYKEEKEKYEKYAELSKKEKEKEIDVLKPQRTQFIVDDVTIEALINLHSQSKNGVGVFKDELAGWFKDMNKYKEGSDKEQWISSWSGRGITVDRITRQSDYIDKPLLPVLGGIQPGILCGFFTSENKESGFLDRMLFSYPDLEVEKYVDVDIQQDVIDYYKKWITYFFYEMKKIIELDENNDVIPKTAKFSPDAKKEWIRIHDKITNLQNSDNTPEFLKSFLPKQKSYIPRFALILNTLHAVADEKNLFEITKKSILDAEKLSEYFVKMNEKMIISNTELSETNETFKNTKGTTIEKLKAIIEQNPNFSKAEIAKKLGISRTSLYNYLKKL